MKTQAMTRHKYIAEFWNFTSQEVEFINPTTNLPEIGIERTHYYSKKIRITLGVDNLNRLKIFCDEPLPVFAHLKNITDIAGTVLLKNGVWQVTSVETVLSAIGLVEGYRMQARLIEGV